MIKIFFGDDRLKIQKEVEKTLGKDYEVIDGEKIMLDMMPSIFFGTSLLTEKRQILIKDLEEQKEAWRKLGDYLKTENEVVVWETKLDKRTSEYKELKKLGIEIYEFRATQLDTREVLEIFDLAWNDGEKAVKMLEKFENQQDPYAFFGLIAGQAIKRFEWRQGEKEKRVLKELSRLDMQMKSTSFSPWTLLKSFLLRISSL